MSKQLIVFDIDNTIVKGQSQKYFLTFLYKHKHISWRHYITVLLWFLMYKFSLTRSPERVMAFAYSFLKGQKPTEIQDTTDNFYQNDLRLRLYPLAIKEVRKHQEMGRDILLLSNAGNPLVEKIASELGVGAFICTQLELKNGVYTGKIEGNSVYGENKVRKLERFLADKRYGEIHGYADHFSDIDLLEFVDVAYAVNPDRKLRRIAESKGWRILNFNLKK